jgi:hypothetical protein
MQTSFLKLLRPLFVLLLLIPAGCAKSPAGGGTSPASGPQLLISLTLGTQPTTTINTNYYYYILFNVNNTPGPVSSGPTGPVPVVTNADFVGNGYAAGAFSHYVEFHIPQPGSNNGFDYYPVNADLVTPEQPTPGQLIAATTDGVTLSFRIPLAYLAASGVSADDINRLEINFVTTNFIPGVGTEPTTPKYLDSLSVPGSTSYSYFDLIVRDSNNVLMPSIHSSDTDSSIIGIAPVSEYVNGVPVQVNPTAPDGGSSDSLQISHWTIQLNSGS